MTSLDLNHDSDDVVISGDAAACGSLERNNNVGAIYLYEWELWV